MASTTSMVICFCLIAALSVFAENADHEGGREDFLDGVLVEASTSGISEAGDVDIYEAVGRVLESLPETDGDDEGDAVENSDQTFINASHELDAIGNSFGNGSGNKTGNSTGNGSGNGTDSNGGFTPSQIITTMWAVSLSFVAFVLLCCFFIYYAHQNNLCSRLCPNRGADALTSSPREASPGVRMMRQLRQSIGRVCDEVLIGRELPTPHLIEEQRDDREQRQSIISDANDGSKELSQSAGSDAVHEHRDSFCTNATNEASETSEPLKKSVAGASELSLSNDTATRESSPFDVETGEATEISIAGTTGPQRTVDTEIREPSQTHVAGTSGPCQTSDAVTIEAQQSIDASDNKPGGDNVSGATASHEDDGGISPIKDAKPLKVFEI